MPYPMRAALLLWLSLGSGLVAAQQPQDMLVGMGEALRAYDFSGEVVLLREGQLEALRVEHAADGDRTEVRPLNRVDGELSRSGQQITFAADRVVDLGEALRVDLTSSGAVDLARSYRLRLVGEDRVAGRNTQVVEVMPRDAWRFGRHFWVDHETGLPLRSSIRSADGNVIEQWMFTRIELISVRPAAPGEAASPQQFLGPQADAIAQTAFRVDGAPEGFGLLAASRSAESEHLVLADGLSKVSVFVEPLRAGQQVLTGAHRRGALHVFGRVIPGYQVVVVGEVPAATVERIAQGVAVASGS